MYTNQRDTGYECKCNLRFLNSSERLWYILSVFSNIFENEKSQFRAESNNLSKKKLICISLHMYLELYS